MTDENKILGQLAFAAYCETTGWVNYQGKDVPPWDELGETIQAAWVAAAGAVRNYVMGPDGQG